MINVGVRNHDLLDLQVMLADERETSSMSSPGSMTMASRVVSSPMIEQLHCSGPTGKISWIMLPL
jgi:hypothetical protein